MASINYNDNGQYKKLFADGADGKTPYVNPSDKHWYIDEEDTGYKAEMDFTVSETQRDIEFNINDNVTTVRKSVDQILGFDIETLSSGNGTLSDKYTEYDYLVIYHKNSAGDITHTQIMCEEIANTNKYQLMSANGDGTLNVATISFPSLLSYSVNGNGITVYRIDGIRTADESNALEIANNILGVTGL